MKKENLFDKISAIRCANEGIDLASNNIARPDLTYLEKYYKMDNNTMLEELSSMLGTTEDYIISNDVNELSNMILMLGIYVDRITKKNIVNLKGNESEFKFVRSRNGIKEVKDNELIELIPYKKEEWRENE